MKRAALAAWATLAIPAAARAQGISPPPPSAATPAAQPSSPPPQQPAVAPAQQPEQKPAPPSADQAWTPPPSVAAEERKKAQEPSLDLPIGWYVAAGALGGLGAAAGILSRGPERDLRDPSLHPTQDATRNLYYRAYYGGLLSKGLYALSGAAGAWAAYKTQSAIRDYLTARARASLADAQDPRLDAALAAAPGQANLTLTYRF